MFGGRLTHYLPSVILGTLLIFGSGFYLGKYGTPETLPLGGRPADLGNFWETKRLIEDKFVGEVKADDLITGATKGLVDGLGDPYSAYLTPGEVAELEQALSGEVEGIGIEVGAENGQVTVIAPLPDSPAAKAGIAAGDIIVAVDNDPTAGKALDEVVKKIRGKKDTTVTLEVRSPAAPASRSVTLTRATVKAPSVTLSYRADVAVIDLSRYGDDTKAELDKAIADIQTKKPRGIVLDLRGNPGGFLEGAIEVTSVFLKEGVVVKEKFKDKTDERRVTPDARLADYPLAVLINKGTASASEITAGALRDNRQVRLVGEQSFGKGSVQELEDLGDGAVLKLTIAEWLTPSGKSISREGLKPDLESSSDNAEAQLQAAIGQLGR